MKKNCKKTIAGRFGNSRIPRPIDTTLVGGLTILTSRRLSLRAPMMAQNAVSSMTPPMMMVSTERLVNTSMMDVWPLRSVSSHKPSPSNSRPSTWNIQTHMVRTAVVSWLEHRYANPKVRVETVGSVSDKNLGDIEERLERLESPLPVYFGN